MVASNGDEQTRVHLEEEMGGPTPGMNVLEER